MTQTTDITELSKLAAYNGLSAVLGLNASGNPALGGDSYNLMDRGLTTTCAVDKPGLYLTKDTIDGTFPSEASGWGFLLCLGSGTGGCQFYYDRRSNFFFRSYNFTNVTAATDTYKWNKIAGTKVDFKSA